MKRNKKDIKIEHFGKNAGVVFSKNEPYLSYRIEGAEQIRKAAAPLAEILPQNYDERYSIPMHSVNVVGWGKRNKWPQDVQKMVSNNKLLPSVLRKRIDFLFGHGPILYTMVEEDGKLVRKNVVDLDVLAWLDSWTVNGLEPWQEYLRNLIVDYYYVGTCCTMWRFPLGNRIRKENDPIGISGLEYIPVDMARLATTKNPKIDTVLNKDCEYVVVGDWKRSFDESKYIIYPRLTNGAISGNESPVAFDSDMCFGRHVYSYSEWFVGLFEWIKASNLTPHYLNSYLKNALNAHVHVKIPQSWVESQQSTLEDICTDNLAGTGGTIIKEYNGVKLVDENDNPLAFNVGMVKDLINCELHRLTEMMSGEDNQGKLFASLKSGQDGWEFEDFPSKFAEYFDAVIKYDKRADQVVIAGIGISSSISNVENDGVISKSGSDVYYNYVIYLNQLHYAEYLVTKQINRAIKMMFPDKDIKVGFDIHIPTKQQDTTPSERLGSNLQQ